MDIHKPKAWHGFREFLKEYLIIVVGVLTALAAEQTVEWLHRQEEVNGARAALHQEIAADLRAQTLQLRDNDCYERRLYAIERWAKGEAPKPRGHGALLSGLASTNWETVRSGPVTYLPLAERLALGKFYGGIDNQLGLIRQLRVESQEIAGFTGREDLQADEARTLLRLVSQTRAIAHAISRNSPGLLELGRDLGVRPASPRPDLERWVDEVCAASPPVPSAGA